MDQIIINGYSLSAIRGFILKVEETLAKIEGTGNNLSTLSGTFGDRQFLMAYFHLCHVCYSPELPNPKPCHQISDLDEVLKRAKALFTLFG